VAVNPRLLAASLGVGLLISVGGGYLLSRSDDGDGDTTTDDEVVLDTPGEAQIPTIGTNAAVEGTALAITPLEDNEGNRLSSADLLGHPLIINVWNSTCAPCKRELPAFAAVHADLGDEIRFVGINNLDTPEVNESFATERGVRYELLRDVADGFASTVGIATLPVTLFVDADGTIVRQTGVLEEDELREYAAELLE
jgi:thiol-disulfide isomerase/thioredoxin